MDDMDRISQLPKTIMQDILFCLPAKDATLMSLTSKTWNSLPIKRYEFDLNNTAKRSAYDKSLSILPEHADQKNKRITFTVKGALRNKKQARQVNSWLKLVTKHGVTNLCLDFYRGSQKIGEEPPRLYSFPPAILRGSGNNILLQELRLTNVDLNGVVGELLSRCPLLETLYFNECVGIKHLQLCEFPNLKNVIFQSCQAFSYKIEAYNLRHLKYDSYDGKYDGKYLDLEAVCCRNLKELILHTDAEITDQYVERLLFKFPSLEKLDLRAAFKSAEVKISSHQLRSLTLICYESSTRVIYKDTPNLLYSSCKFFEPLPNDWMDLFD